MRPTFISIIAAAFAVTAVLPAARGHQIIVIEDAASDQQFASAVQGFTFLGSEEFAGSILDPSAEQDLGTHTLAPGTSAPSFPGGADPTLGLTFQSNSLGSLPLTPSPGGSLYASGSAVGGAGMIRIGPEATSHSLDIFFDPPDFRGLVRGVAFTVFQEGGGDAVVRIYNSDNVELASTMVEGLGLEETKRVGLIAPEGETIFRVSYWVPDGYGDVGELELYAIPEPAAYSLALAALSGLFLLRRRWGAKRQPRRY